MKPITCIFFGKSGSGKGTQAKLLMSYIAKHDPRNKVVYVETGEGMRNVMSANDSYVAHRIKETMAKGGLMPASIAIWLWQGEIEKNIETGNEHLIFDGVARRVDEAPILDHALQFVNRGTVHVILLDVPHEEVTARLLKRGRADDHHEKITERLKWFETDVMPSINYFKKSKHCTFLEIDGHKTIEEVHVSILKELGV